MSISTIVFDAYGTLIDTADGSIRATEAILRKNRSNLDPEEFYARWKVYHQQIISMQPVFASEESVFLAGLSQLYRDYSIKGDPAADVQIMLATLGVRKVFADTLPCLHRLRDRFEIVIASNTDTAPFLADLQNNNMAVDKWFTSESLRAYKPDRIFFERMLSRLHRRPHKVVFVGDTLDADVIGPREYGMQSIWLKRKQKRAAMPDIHEISTLAELDSALVALQTPSEPID